MSNEVKLTLLLKQIFSLIKLLNSETGTNQIAAGVAAGWVLGMTPAFSLQTILILMLCLTFRIQLGAMFLSAFFFSFIAYLLDSIFHQVGLSVLNMPHFAETWTALYNMPIIPWTRFNNTIVMGSGIVAFVLFPVVFLLAKFLIKKYRQKIVARFQQTKFFKALKATFLYQWYYKYDNLYGN